MGQLGSKIDETKGECDGYLMCFKLVFMMMMMRMRMNEKDESDAAS